MKSEQDCSQRYHIMGGNILVEIHENNFQRGFSGNCFLEEKNDRKSLLQITQIML